VDSRIEETRGRIEALQARVRRWVRLFAEPVDFAALTRVEVARQSETNIAGVSLPVLDDVVFARAPLDLFATPPWFDDAVEALEQRVRLELEAAVLREQRRRLAEELRTTAQRVNLFEKIKIPEARENIRVIKIFLGDEQTAAVARAKFAKSRAEASAHDGVLYAGAVESEEVPA
jgi:V/A-type H+-transporting ATPase subunit D